MPLFYCTVSETSSKLSVCLDQYHQDNFYIVMCKIPHVESLKTSDFVVFKKTLHNKSSLPFSSEEIDQTNSKQQKNGLLFEQYNFLLIETFANRIISKNIETKLYKGGFI